ncbi:MAG: hypothetical protein V7785_20875 [Bermanella sp.]
MKHKLTSIKLTGFITLMISASVTWSGTMYSTLPPSDITKTSVTFNGTSASTSHGWGSESFIYWPAVDTKIKAGVSAHPQRTIGPVTALTTGLTCGTEYKVKLKGSAGSAGTTVQGQVLTFNTLACASNISNFTQNFSPEFWQKGSNPEVGLVNFSGDTTATLQNYTAWKNSGATLGTIVGESGTITFDYQTLNTTSVCPAAYTLNTKVIKLSKASGTLSIPVNQGDTFVFALNGNNEPGDFSCEASGEQISFTITNFSFIQSS